MDDFASDPAVLANAEIPVNTDIQYTKPQPRIPLEEEVDFPFA
jgi:hypothetical protein